MLQGNYPKYDNSPPGNPQVLVGPLRVAEIRTWASRLVASCKLEFVLSTIAGVWSIRGAQA